MGQAVSEGAPPGGLVRQFIRGIDWVLRRHYGVEIYSDHPDCLLRVSRGSSDVDIVLSDGTSIQAGDSLLDLHLWNERLASHVHPLDDLARGRALLRYLRASLRLLNEWVSRSTRLCEQNSACLPIFVRQRRSSKGLVSTLS